MTKPEAKQAADHSSTTQENSRESSQENRNDKWIKCIARAGNLNATAITAKDLIENARKRHKLGSAETKALGEVLMAGLLLASTCKTGERVSISVKGNGVFRQAIADADPSGNVRGFIVSTDIAGELDQKMGPWQSGLLSVVRLKKNEKEPYVGTVPIITGHLAKDLTFYLSQSEQIPSAVGLAVNLDEEGKVESAGAFLVQVMPGASKAEILMVESNIDHLESLASRIEEDSDPTKLLGRIFEDLSFALLEERRLRFECNCSKDRVTRALKLVGKAELNDMIAKDNGAEVNCDFCGSKFSYSADDLQKIINDI